MNRDECIEASVFVGEAKGNVERVLPAGQSGCNLTWNLPSRLGTGSVTTECLPSGVTMTVSRYKLENSFYAQLEASADDITLVFGLSGRSVNKNTFFKQGFGIEAGSNYMYRFPDPKLEREARKGEQLDALVLTIPMDRFDDLKLLNNADHVCEKKISDHLGGNEDFCLRKNANSQPVVTILEQIIHCPFLGQTRRFFLEAKALELMALKLDMISGMPPTPVGVNEEQMQGVLAARDLLLEDIQNPPSSRELTKVAGMSHPRLSTSFKLVFDCTPFELLRQKRLQWACEQVGANELSLTEIAYAAGYSSASHFSKAFSDYYGIQPGRYRAKKTGNPLYSLPRSLL